MLEQELKLESGLFFFLNGNHTPFCDHFWWLYSHKLTWIPFYLCFLFVFIYKKDWREWLLVILSMALLVVICDQLSSHIAKPLFHRLRPTHHPDFQSQVSIVLGYRGGLYGFFSGHAANSFGFAMLTALLIRKKAFSLMIFTYAILMSYSRVYLGVHFLSDVLVGMLVGLSVGYLVYLIYCQIRKKWLHSEFHPKKDSLYSSKEAYGLIIAFLISIALFLVFNNQLVNLLSPRENWESNIYLIKIIGLC